MYHWEMIWEHDEFFQITDINSDLNIDAFIEEES
jgi:hypothetical protein